MSRRKELTVEIKKLGNSEDIIELLRSDPMFEGYDFSTLTLKIKADINPVIKDAKRAYEFLTAYMAANPNCIEYFQDEPMVDKKHLARMMCISRTTLDKWIKDELIPVRKSKYVRNIEIYDINDIILHLKAK